MSVLNVPIDIIKYGLLPFLNYKDLGNLSAVCSDWRAYILHKYANEIGRKLGALNLSLESKMNVLELLDMWYAGNQPLSCGENHGAMIAMDGSLYVWYELSQRIKRDLPIGASKPRTVCCGYGQTLVLTSSGCAFSFGRNDRGQLGVGDKLDRINPERVQITEPIMSAKAGDGYSIFLTKTNKLYGSGRLEIPPMGENLDVTTPVEIPFKHRLKNEQITQIAAGAKHILVLTNMDRLFSAGNFEQSRLGRPISEEEPACELNLVRFSNCPSSSCIVQISAGSSHSLVLIGDGTVFTFGTSSSGELGLPSFRDANTAQMIPNLPHAVSVSAGNHHSLVLASTRNKIVAFGMGALGQLGYRLSFWSSTYPRDSPLPPDEQKRIKHISGGNGFSACMASDSSDLFTCGKSSLCAGAGHGVQAGNVLAVFSRVPDV